jgi:hypothetical protein
MQESGPAPASAPGGHCFCAHWLSCCRVYVSVARGKVLRAALCRLLVGPSQQQWAKYVANGLGCFVSLAISMCTELPLCACARVQDFWNVDASDPMAHCARFFYGPMLQGRDGIGACTCCGTGRHAGKLLGCSWRQAAQLPLPTSSLAAAGCKALCIVVCWGRSVARSSSCTLLKLPQRTPSLPLATRPSGHRPSEQGAPHGCAGAPSPWGTPQHRCNFRELPFAASSRTSPATPAQP